MNPMDRIRALFEERFANATNQQAIADLIGVTAPTVHRFLKGIFGSPKIAKYMSDTYGGECTELYELILKYKQPRKPRKSPQLPPPSSVVGRAAYTAETHHVPHLEGGLTAYWLPGRIE